MRNFMQALQEPVNGMAYVESDKRFGDLLAAVTALRGYNPHEKMTRAEHDEMKEMGHQFTTTIAGLSADYDLPAEQIRQHAVGRVKSHDN